MVSKPKVRNIAQLTCVDSRMVTRSLREALEGNNVYTVTTPGGFFMTAQESVMDIFDYARATTIIIRPHKGKCLGCYIVALGLEYLELKRKEIEIERSPAARALFKKEAAKNGNRGVSPFYKAAMEPFTQIHNYAAKDRAFEKQIREHLGTQILTHEQVELLNPYVQRQALLQLLKAKKRKDINSIRCRLEDTPLESDTRNKTLLVTMTTSRLHEEIIEESRAVGRVYPLVAGRRQEIVNNAVAAVEKIPGMNHLRVVIDENERYNLYEPNQVRTTSEGVFTDLEREFKVSGFLREGKDISLVHIK